MATKLITIICFTIAQYHITNGQCVNRQPTCSAMNEAIVETPRNVIPQQMTTAFAPQNTIVEAPCIHQIPKANALPGPVTIITDYSPAMCKNLADTLQLMVVCNLLQNTKGGSDVALKLASPIINEVLSSPAFSCGCTNPLYSNTMIPNMVTAPTINPNFITPNIISSFPPTPLATPCNKGILSNIMSLLSSLN